MKFYSQITNLFVSLICLYSFSALSHDFTSINNPNPDRASDIKNAEDQGYEQFALDTMPITPPAAADYKLLCSKDLEFLSKHLRDNSMNFANKPDIYFHSWYNQSQNKIHEMLQKVHNAESCYYLMQYYLNGFRHSNIMLNYKYALPKIKYAGFLTERRYGGRHYITYKNPDLPWLARVKIGDEIISINGMDAETYYQESLKPFYASSEAKEKLASVYAMISDGNIFRSEARQIVVNSDSEDVLIEPEYLNLSSASELILYKEAKPANIEHVTVDLISNGVWIKIPSFAPERHQVVHFSNMLSRLKSELAREEYIVFDLRGNKGGLTRWSVPIIRNLWGDDYIKSLGANHDYNSKWLQNFRVSADNFALFKRYSNASDSKLYLKSLRRKDDVLTKEISIFDEVDNLYTSHDASKFNARIYVLTDNICSNNCWNFVKEIKQIPSVVHLGSPISIETPYTGIKKVSSPSGMFEFSYPTQLRIKPKNDIGIILKPDHLYENDWQDETVLIEWVVATAENRNIEHSDTTE